MKSTKRKLIFSSLSLILCAAILIGTTFAWFTDTATSQANKIQAGTLDISLYEKNEEGEFVLLENEAPVFDYDKWEPGYTAIEELQIRTAGNLALRYQVTLQGLDELDPTLTLGIENVLDVTVNDVALGTLADFASGENTLLAGTLLPAEDKTSAALKIQIHMRENAGNEYQGAVLPEFDILVTAAQYTYESDSFDNQYDAGALPQFGIVAYQPVAVENGAVAETVIVKENVTVTVPPTVLVGGAPITPETTLKLSVVSTEADPTFAATVEAANLVSLDISLTDSTGNPVTAAPEADPIPVTIPLAAGLFNLKVYHNGTELAADAFEYNDETGLLTIYATGFSPYAIAYDTRDDVTEWSLLADTAWYDADPTATSFTIDTAEELAGVAKLANAGTSFAGKTIVLGGDIHLEGKKWTGINAWNGKFNRCILDGANHTIYGLDVYGASEAGMFVAGASSLTVKDLTFDGAKAETETNKRQSYAGVLMSKNYSNLIIQNVCVKNSKVINNWQCGGLVGFAEGNAPVFIDCTIRDSFAGGYNCTSGTLFGLGAVNVNISGCTAENVQLYTDSQSGIFWVGSLYGRTLTVTDSTETNVTVVSTYPD